MVRYKGGIDLDSEFREYQEKAKKWESAKKLREERAACKTRIRQIAQEESKLFGEQE